MIKEVTAGMGRCEQVAFPRDKGQDAYEAASIPLLEKWQHCYAQFVLFFLVFKCCEAKLTQFDAPCFKSFLRDVNQYTSFHKSTDELKGTKLGVVTHLWCPAFSACSPIIAES